MSHDFKKLNPSDRERILRQIRMALVENPKEGEPLRGEFGGLFKLRIGAYRVTYALSGQNVLVLRISHRGKAYD